MTSHAGPLQRFTRNAGRWPDRLRLPLVFDAARLAADLTRVEALSWTRHFVPEHYRGDWDVLPLRMPANACHPILRIAPDPACSSWENAELLSETPYFRRVLGSFACPLQAVRLMRLGPGSVIKPHRDHDLDAEAGTARLHVPITTNPNVAFQLNGTRVEMVPGTVWYLRLSDPHTVTNAGTAARVHLVIDALVDPWLEGLLNAASEERTLAQDPCRSGVTVVG